MFGQTFSPNDLLIVALLVLLEGVLSIDNAVVLGLLAKRVRKSDQAKALSYGLVGAFVFRLIAIALAQYLLKLHVVKLLGGLYLIYVGGKHLLFAKKDEHHPTDEGAASKAFWGTVIAIELTDIAFAADSILAAIALVGPAPEGSVLHPKLWVVVVGGMLGVVLMRMAAALFIKLLERFPRFELSAYLLVIVIGMKLMLDWAYALDFHSRHSPAFWAFWGTMLICLLVGFIPHREAKPESAG